MLVVLDDANCVKPLEFIHLSSLVELAEDLGVVTVMSCH